MAVSRWLVVLPLLVLPLFGQTPEAPLAVPAIIGDGWERETPTASGFDATRLRTCGNSASICRYCSALFGHPPVRRRLAKIRRASRVL